MNSSHIADPGIVIKLTSMGIGRELAEQACIATSNVSPAAAVRWALDHFAEEVKKVMDETSSPSSLGTASAHSRQHTPSDRISIPSSAKNGREQPTVWASRDIGQSSADTQRRKLTTAGSRSYEIIENYPETQGIRIKDSPKQFDGNDSASKNQGSLPPQPVDATNSADRRVFPHRNRISALLMRNVEAAPAQNSSVVGLERPGSGWTHKSAFEEMRQLRSELALLRSELREDKAHSIHLGRSRQKPGMIYAHRVIPMSHVD